MSALAGVPVPYSLDLIATVCAALCGYAFPLALGRRVTVLVSGFRAFGSTRLRGRTSLTSFTVLSWSRFFLPDSSDDTLPVRLRATPG